MRKNTLQSSSNRLDSNLPGQPQLIEEVGLGPDLRDGLPHIVDAANGVVRSFTRDRAADQDCVQAHRLASEDIPRTVVEVEHLGRVDPQKLHRLLHARNRRFANNRNCSIQLHVLLSSFTSRFRYGAVTVEGLETQDSLEQILHAQQFQHYVGVDLVGVCKDVLRLRHALQQVAKDRVGSEEMVG